MTAPSEPSFRYHRPGLAFEVWPNRVEVQERGGFLGIGGKKLSLLMRNITDVQVEGFTKQVTITTSDGKKHKWQLGSDGEQARAAILAQL